jgi:hypothetical protein
MATYRIRNTLSPVELRHIGPEYLTHIKQKMIRDLAAKMFEVFGDLPVKTDHMTGEQYLEFTLGAWEDHEVTRFARTAQEQGFFNGVKQATDEYRDRIEELVKQLAQKETPDLADRG